VRRHLTYPSLPPFLPPPLPLSPAAYVLMEAAHDGLDRSLLEIKGEGREGGREGGRHELKQEKEKEWPLPARLTAK